MGRYPVLSWPGGDNVLEPRKAEVRFDLAPRGVGYERAPGHTRPVLAQRLLLGCPKRLGPGRWRGVIMPGAESFLLLHVRCCFLSYTGLKDVRHVGRFTKSS